jgi:hypothetical protein
MGCEESFIIMKLHCHSYLVFSLGNCAHEMCTGLKGAFACHNKIAQHCICFIGANCHDLSATNYIN